MKYADFMGKDTGVNSKDCIAKAIKSSLDVRHARSAMNVLDKDSGAPYNGTAAMHGYWRKRRGARWKGPSKGKEMCQAFEPQIVKRKEEMLRADYAA